REISIPLENKLQLGKKYVFFITTNPKNLNATTYKSLSIPSMPQETSTCSPKEIVSTRKIASQWSTAFPSIKLFPLHGFINVSFFGAPQNLCIYRYMVQLWLDGVLLVEEIIVSQDDLRMDESRNLIGSAIFEKAEHGKNYSIKVYYNSYSPFQRQL
uniref:ILCR1 Ig-like domain-containing protein n=1 Tax=Acrobeloides nanus TaxID=290746 RepID=A0A914D352_9BILA